MEATAASDAPPESTPPASGAPAPSPVKSSAGRGANEPATGATAAMTTSTAPAPQEMKHAAAPDSVAAMPPTTVNTAAATAAMVASSAMTAMTPTTTNYGMNAQLVKSTGTLTPMGEDKVSTAGPSVSHKAKATKKKAVAEGEPAKKPSPRVRTPGGAHTKAEKRKASPGRNGAGNTTPSSAGSATSALAPAMPKATSATTPTSNSMANPMYTAAHAGENAAMGSQQELTPAQDTELRKQFLQRIYRQLQMTHRNQDDTMVRRLATSIEIDICRRAATRNDYVALMNQQIHSLMQAELTNGSVGLQSSLYVPGQSMPPSSGPMGTATPTSNGMAHNPVGAAGAGGFKADSSSESGDVGQRSSAPNQGSFMSLLSSQAPMQPFESNRPPQQFASTPGVQSHGRPHQYASMNSAPGYPTHGQAPPHNAEMKNETPDQLTQAGYPGQRMPAPATSTTAPPEFAAQFQRLDRNGLVDLLWTQHKTVIQYQRRLAQLEVQLNSRQPGTVMPPNGMATTPNGMPSGYYGASPRQPQVGGGISPAVSAEAEAQRARDRASSRGVSPQAPAYGQPQYPQAQPPATPSASANPTQYWERVRFLKEAYLRPLYVAHQALSQHSAPANSAQGVKAENVKHNISLACSILAEPPKLGVQPRPVEVLDSIERFIQSTVVPIVRKVSPQLLMQPMASTPDGVSAQQMRPPQQMQGEFVDSTRAMMGSSMSPQPSTTPTTTGAAAPGGMIVPPSAPSIASAKGGKGAVAKAGAKAGGRKAPPSAPKKAATPKSSTPKNATKASVKKSPKGGAKLASATKVPPRGDDSSSIAMDTEAPATMDGSASSSNNLSAEDPEKDRSGLPPMKSGAITDDDSLNDFSDFADLDFGDDLQDPLAKVQNNKENSTGVNARKRSIEDV